MPDATQRQRTIPNLAVPPDGRWKLKPDGRHFELVPSGYHPGRVDAYVHLLLEKLRAAEQRAAQAADAVAKVAATPQSRQLLADLIKVAADEITGRRDAAAAEGAQIIADARATAEAILAQANDDGAQLVSGAREQADSVVSDARASATQLMDKATAGAQVVTDHAQRRMEALLRLHGQTLSQLRKIHEVSGGTLEMEAQRGSLADEVARAMGESPGAAEATPRGELEAPAE